MTQTTTRRQTRRRLDLDPYPAEALIRLLDRVAASRMVLDPYPADPIAVADADFAPLTIIRFRLRGGAS